MVVARVPFGVSLLELIFLLLPIAITTRRTELSSCMSPGVNSRKLKQMFVNPSYPCNVIGPSPSYAIRPGDN